MTPREITTHKKACEVLGKDPNESKSIHDQLDDIADAINKVDNYQVDFNDTDQEKWRPYFRMDASGFRFDDSNYVSSCSNTDVGSRLCQYFRNQEIADFFGKHFESLHRKCFFRKKLNVTNYSEITSHEIACEVLGKEPSESVSVHDQLDDIAKAINKVDGDYKADYSNNEPKWYPWFTTASGFRFFNSCYANSDSNTDVGSRLCQRFRSQEASDFFGKTFEALHRKSFNA